MYFFTDWSTSVHLLLGIKRTSADLFPINLISRELFLELFLFSTTSFYSLLLPPSQLFETCYCHQSRNELIFFFRNSKRSQFKMSCFQCSVMTKIWAYWIFRSLHSVLIYILRNVPIL